MPQRQFCVTKVDGMAIKNTCKILFLVLRNATWIAPARMCTDAHVGMCTDAHVGMSHEGIRA